MKDLSLSSKFYILFSLTVSGPAFWLSNKITNFIELVPKNNVLYKTYSWGILDTPTALMIILGAFWLFNNYLWKISVIKKILGTPNINGRYEGKLFSSFDETKEYPVAIEIEQTLTNIDIFLYTPTSCSYSLVASLCKNNKGNKELVYIYQNKTAELNNNQDMRDHLGTTSLEIFDDGKIMKGSYFNNPRERCRFGKIEIEKIGTVIKRKF